MNFWNEILVDPSSLQNEAATLVMIPAGKLLTYFFFKSIQFIYAVSLINRAVVLAEMILILTKVTFIGVEDSCNT